MAYVRYNNSNYYYEVHGNGEPILIIHDMKCCSPELMKNIHNILQNKYKIIILYLPKNTKSEAIDFSHDKLSKIITKLINRLGIYQVNLLGLHMGLIISFDYALRKPGRVKNLVLLEANMLNPGYN